MTFQLNTSGDIPHVAPNGDPIICGGVSWPDLSPFMQGYIEALFASTYDVLPGLMATADQPRDGYLKTAAVGFRDLAPETLARIIADCRALVASGAGATAEDGRATWELRQNDNFEGFPPLNVQLGDDGKVRFGEAG